MTEMPKIGEVYEHNTRLGQYRICNKIFGATGFMPDDMEEVAICFDEGFGELELHRLTDLAGDFDCIFRARVQAPKEGYHRLLKGRVMWIVYQQIHDLSLWIRVESEFIDGRFRKLER